MDKTVASLTSSTPTIDDLTISYDNADTSELKKTTWQLVRDLFKTYFDTIYQAVLVSWTNIKTINSTSILGSWDIVISGTGNVATDAIWDAKWDLAGWTGANTASRLAVGTNGQVLVADSAEATGMKWATATGTGDMLASTYDPAGIAQQVAGLTATQTFSTGVKTFLAGMFWLRNVANTFTSFFTNTNTASRTYTLKDANGTLAFTTDITGTNSGTNTGDETASRIGTLINGSTDQPTPADTDLFAIWISSTLRKLTYANLKAGIKSYYDSVTATLTNKTLTAPVITTAINAQTGTTYTLVLTDQSKLITLTNASAIAVTIPTNASVAFPVWTQIDFSQDGAWKVTFSGAGVTINSLSSLKSIGGQYVGATLVKTATDTWNLYWNLIS